jgi:hypothetical protein
VANCGYVVASRGRETCPVKLPPRSTAWLWRRPNTLVICGVDIGIHNISAYNLGVMGYQAPNIDRLGKQGSSLNASGINYNPLQALKRLKEWESIAPPNN